MATPNATIQFNPADILRYLDCGDFIVMQKETGGMDTQIWKVMIDEGYAALRVFRPEQAEQFRFEIQAMNLASAAGIPVPGVLRSGMFRSHPCMVLEWIDGKTLSDACDSPEAMSHLGRAAGRLHRRLHEDTMRQDGTSLLHLDYHPLNILVDFHGIAAVIDWTNSSWGDPRRDVARTVSLLLCTPLLDRSEKDFARMTRRFTREYLTGYGESKGLKPFIQAETDWLIQELDHHISQNGLIEPPQARRLIARWKSFNL